MIVGNVQFKGKAPFRDVVFSDRITKVKKEGWIVAPLNKCKELIDTGDFIPDEQTQKLFDQFGGLTHNKTKVDGMLKGKNCFIIGGGNSLRGFDFSLLDKEFTIAINHSLISYPKAKSCIFLDSRYLTVNDNEAKNFLKTYKGLKFCSFRTLYQRDDLDAIPFYVQGDKVENSFIKGLYGSRLSGLAAISLAIIMKAEKIYLLGYDLDEKDENVHFYDEPGKVKYGNDKGYRGLRIKGHIESFKKFEPFKDRIVNLNPKSKITYFEFRTPEEVLNGL